jgi:C4-dicarboxylate transporter
VALPVEGSGSATVGIAIETNTALGVAAQKVAAVGLATTGETVFPVSGVKILTAGMGLEFDIALPVSSSVPSASNLSMLIDGEFKSRTLEMFTELGWVPTEWEVL